MDSTSVTGKPLDSYPTLDEVLVCNGTAQKKLRECGLFLLSICKLQQITEVDIKICAKYIARALLIVWHSQLLQSSEQTPADAAATGTV